LLIILINHRKRVTAVSIAGFAPENRTYPLVEGQPGTADAPAGAA